MLHSEDLVRATYATPALTSLDSAWTAWYTARCRRRLLMRRGVALKVDAMSAESLVSRARPGGRSMYNLM
jgi:hypothetical protein